MPEIRSSLFHRTRDLISRFDEFLDRVSEGAMVFQKGLNIYMEQGAGDDFEREFEKIDGIESRGDELRRAIETELYTEMLLPDVRGDLLSLLDDLDHLLDIMEHTVLNFLVERPDFPEQCHRPFLDLVEAAVNGVDAIIAAARDYTRSPEQVRDQIHKIEFYENEADELAMKLGREIFGSDLPLERKIHLRRFVRHVDQVADDTEDAADKLAIYSVKRSL